VIGQLNLKYKYITNGFSYSGAKIPDIPIVHLVLRRKDKKIKAVGTAIVDTGFDGGIYPSISLLNFFEGLNPICIEKLSSAFEEKIECEVYKVEASLISEDNNIEINLKEVNVYIPIDPAYIGEEVLIGREVLNRLKIILDGVYSEFTSIH
jgi:hypothetical protein